MNWGSVGEFFAMGGYAGYVWWSYGVAAACVVLEIAALVARTRRVEREMQKSAAR